eukprot:TRINITY_DN522_c0_g1_i1.p1 TRINITY_DN522_c0_g1~~TRINITY_DN522_c0_g1_i1.p1  ORF type:complete len:573 (-),score=121.31 TRINITY_DN522_c0_g1_i1:153-1871(-)
MHKVGSVGNLTVEAYLAPLVLCSAASKGDLEMVKRLIESEQYDPNAGDYDGRTPLHLATEEGHIEVVKLLLSKGVDVNVVDRWGATPLRGAVSYNRRDIATLLKDSGATFKLSSHKNHSTEQAVADEVRHDTLRDIFHNLHAAKSGNLEKGAQLAPVSIKKIVKYLEEVLGLAVKKNVQLYDQLRTLLPGQNSATGPTDEKKVSSKVAALINLGSSEAGMVTFEAFEKMMTGESLLQRALDDRLVVPNWSSFCREVENIFESVRAHVPTSAGHNADYIPELDDIDSELYGLTIVTVDGQVLNLGNFDNHFSIQSCHKPLTYSLACEKLGSENVHKYVGQEPSGVAFNAFTLNKNKKPHNPCVNSGAIMVASLYQSDLQLSKRFKSLTESYSELSGGEKIGFSQSVYLSEKNCAHRNFALAHFMASEGGFPPNTDILEAVDFYFQACSCEVDCFTLASIAATYANNGRNPLTAKKLLSPTTVKNTLQVMNSCGMYDFSGEWACTVGLPAKSGVAGSIFMVIPDVLGICVYSPPLDPQGNSVRGVEFCQRFAQKFNWSLLDVLFSRQYDNRKPH